MAKIYDEEDLMYYLRYYRLYLESRYNLSPKNTLVDSKKFLKQLRKNKNTLN